MTIDREPIPSVYNRALSEVPKPFQFESDGWSFVESHPRLSIPEKRLEAFANIINNGAKCAVVLSMDPAQTWESITTIRHNANKLSQEQTIAQDRSVQRFMVDVMERIGAVARGSRDETEWQLTPFGLAIKPAIIYTKEMCTLLGIDATDVVGNLSLPTTDKKGDIIITPAARRIGLLKEIYDVLERTGAEEVDFQTIIEDMWILTDVIDIPEGQSLGEEQDVEVMEVVDSTALTHLKNLAESKFVEIKMANTTVGEFVKYKPIPTKFNETWLPARAHQKSSRQLWQAIQTAIIEMHRQGQERFGIKDVFNKIINLHVSPNTLSTILAELARLGYIENTEGLSNKKRSIVKLTPLGKNVYELITKPLYLWFTYPEKVPAINRAAESYAHNFAAYQSFVHQIAMDFREHSPYVNADPEGKKSKIMELIAENDGKLTVVEIADALGLKRANVYDHCHDLARMGKIRSEPNGSRKRYFLNQEGKPKPIHARSSQKAG